MESLRGYAADIEGGRQPFRDNEKWLESRKLSGEGLLEGGLSLLVHCGHIDHD